jgi:hypothetical protein
VAVRASQAVILDASGSRDPDNGSSTLEYRWECARADTGAACVTTATTGTAAANTVFGPGLPFTVFASKAGAYTRPLSSST